MPAIPRLDARQAAYASRVMGFELPSTRQIAVGNTQLARRLQAAVRPGGGDHDVPVLEQVRAPRGLRFPGSIVMPEMASGEERTLRGEKAIRTAQLFETDTRAIWTDGSALLAGTCAAAVVGFVEGFEDSDQDSNRVVRERVGVVGCGRKKKMKENEGRTYGERFRSFRRYGSERGMRAEAWCLKGSATAFDAELAATVRGFEICLMDSTLGASFNIFTDSQAAMKKLETDDPGSGQRMAIRESDWRQRRSTAVQRYPSDGYPATEFKEMRSRMRGHRRPR